MRRLRRPKRIKNEKAKKNALPPSKAAEEPEKQEEKTLRVIAGLRWKKTNNNKNKNNERWNALPPSWEAEGAAEKEEEE